MVRSAKREGATSGVPLANSPFRQSVAPGKQSLPSRRLLFFLWRLPRIALIAVIRVYQLTLSPDHGPLKHLYPYGYCKHEPTCSQYAITRLRTFGFVLGTLLALRRVMTCTPFAKPSDEKLRSLAEKQLHTGE